MKRSNEEWLTALHKSGDAQDQALSDLREYLVRAAYVYLRDGRSELSHLSTNHLYEMAEDYAQNALMSIQNSLEKFRGDAKFTTWSYRFVINEAAADLRKKQYREFSWDEVREQGTAVFTAVLATTTALEPELKTERAELIRFLLQIIETELNERQQIALLEIHFRGRSMQEVAEILETTPNTVYKMLHDARKKIRAKLLARHYSAGDVLGLFDNVW